MPFSRRNRTADQSTTASGGASAQSGGSENSAANSAAGDRPWYESLWSWMFGGSNREAPAPRRAEEEVHEQVTEDPGLLDLAQDEVELPTEVVTRAQERSEDAKEKVTLASGRTYIVAADDLSGSDAWRTIARNHGMSAENLVPFNQHVREVSQGDSKTQFTTTTELAAGVEIYIPSAEEILFGQCRKKAKGYDEAVELFGEMKQGTNVKLLTMARERASGKVGESYGTKGVDGGYFMTENPTIAGASNRRTEEIGGKKQYKVFWIDDFWKCSLFMHDVVWSAGYEPHQNSNNHYELAGKLHQSKKYEEIDVKDARPGDAWQRFGGTGSDESHNAILSSFVDITDQGGDYEEWRFTIIGAEADRAAEGENVHTIKKGTNQNTQGKNVRFFRPVGTRTA